MNASEAARAVTAALDVAAEKLGPGPVAGEKSSAQILADGPSRISATRWRSGDAARRLTATLARAKEALQQWVGAGPYTEPRRPPTVAAPVQPLPVRRQPGYYGPPAGPSCLWHWFQWRLPRAPVSWRVVLALLVVLFFPRLVALSVALVVRLALKAVVNLTTHLVRELYYQVFQVTAELEEQMVAWLQQQLGFGPTTTPALDGHARADFASPVPVPVPAPSPARPVDWAALLLLFLNLRQRFVVGGGGEVPRHP